MTRFAIVFFTLLAIAGCKKKKDKTEFSGFGSAQVNGAAFECTVPDFVVNDYENPGSGKTETRTTVNLPGTDGTLIAVSFEGTDAGNFALAATGITTASYTDLAANEYNSVSGDLVINEYVQNDNETRISGSFDFSAQSFVDQSLLTVSNGNFTVTKSN